MLHGGNSGHHSTERAPKHPFSAHKTQRTASGSRLQRKPYFSSATAPQAPIFVATRET